MRPKTTIATCLIATILLAGCTNQPPPSNATTSEPEPFDLDPLLQALNTTHQRLDRVEHELNQTNARLAAIDEALSHLQQRTTQQAQATTSPADNATAVLYIFCANCYDGWAGIVREERAQHVLSYDGDAFDVDENVTILDQVHNGPDSLLELSVNSTRVGVYLEPFDFGTGQASMTATLSRGAIMVDMGFSFRGEPIKMFG